VLHHSVANSWQRYSARSTAKFGHGQKNSAAHPLFCKSLIYLVYSKILWYIVKVLSHDILGSNSAKCHKILSEKHTSKSSAPFLPFFWEICIKFGRGLSRPLRFFWGHFCILRQKFRPVGNTAPPWCCFSRPKCHLVPEVRAIPDGLIFCHFLFKGDSHTFQKGHAKTYSSKLIHIYITENSKS
jgi:hypothetical protein